jgi:hypothetical protein
LATKRDGVVDYAEDFAEHDFPFFGDFQTYGLNYFSMAGSSRMLFRLLQFNRREAWPAFDQKIIAARDIIPDGNSEVINFLS